jgi:uncharacterized protein with ParB-like and HNH nuclease domain
MRIGVNGPWITKSYLELILERKGLNWHDNDQYSVYEFWLLCMIKIKSYNFLQLANSTCRCTTS